jgi:peptidoglycan hydrolase-like protein with peptidoglycan-binding domain
MKAALLLSLLLGASALAADVRDVQAELKNQGFYFGEVDGNDGPETTAAIRRFQIRNGLEVSGKLTDETLSALGMAPAATAKTTPKPATPATPPAATNQVNPPAVGSAPPAMSAPTARPRQDLLREADEEAVGGLRNRGPGYPDDPAVVPAPRSIPNPVDTEDYATFFHGTPYANAPLEVQFEVVRRAQQALARMGFYQGSLNGLPATLTSDALFQYQYQRRLNRTGRLDLQTLAELELLPGRGENPGVRPFTNPNRRRDPSVDYRGMIR